MERAGLDEIVSREIMGHPPRSPGLTGYLCRRFASLTTLKVGVQIDRDGKAPVGRSLRSVVPMRAEMAAVLGGIAGDDVALHARRREEVDLLDLRINTADDPPLEVPD